MWVGGLDPVKCSVLVFHLLIFRLAAQCLFYMYFNVHCSIAPIEGALLKSQRLETRLCTHGFPPRDVRCVYGVYFFVTSKIYGSRRRVLIALVDLFLKECYKIILKMRMHNTLLHVRIMAYVSVNVLSTLEFLIKAFYYVRSAGPKSGQQFSVFFFMTCSQACIYMYEVL